MLAVQLQGCGLYYNYALAMILLLILQLKPADANTSTYECTAQTRSDVK